MLYSLNLSDSVSITFHLRKRSALVVEIFLKEEHRRCADALVFQEMATCWLRCLVFVLEQVTVARCV